MMREKDDEEQEPDLLLLLVRHEQNKKNKYEEKVFWNREKEKLRQMNKEFFSHSVVDFGVKGV